MHSRIHSNVEQAFNVLPEVMARWPSRDLQRIRQCFLSCFGKPLHPHVEFYSADSKLLKVRVQAGGGLVSYLFVFKTSMEGMRKEVFFANRCDWKESEQRWETTALVYAESNEEDSADYFCAQNLRMHKIFSKKIPGSISLYPYEESDEGITPVMYVQKYYPKTLQSYAACSPFKLLRLLQAATKALADLHGIYYQHGDVATSNIFIEKEVSHSGKKVYKARLNDFDLSEDLRASNVILYSLQAPDLLASQIRIIGWLLNTHIFDTLSLLYGVCGLMVPSLQVLAELSPKKLLVHTSKELNSYFDELVAGIAHPVQEGLQSSEGGHLQMRIGALFCQVALAAKDLQIRAEKEPGFYEILAMRNRSQGQVEMLMQKIHETFPRMQELHELLTSSAFTL